MKSLISGKKAFLGSLTFAFVLSSSLFLWAAYSDWVDTNWSSSSTYQQKDALIDNSTGPIKLGTETKSLTETSYTDFLSGTYDATRIDVSAVGRVILKPTVSDPFSTDLKEWLGLPPIPSLVSNSRFTIMGDYLYCVFASGDGKQFGRISLASLKAKDIYEPADGVNTHPPKWEFLEPIPAPVSAGTAITNDGQYIYVLRGGGSKEAYFYLPYDSEDPNPSNILFKSFSSPTPGHWKLFGTSGLSLPQGISKGSSIVHVGNPLTTRAGNLYVIRGGNTKDCYRFVNAVNSCRWEARASTPWDIGDGGSLAHKPGTDYIYGVSGSKIFYYKVSTNEWFSDLPDVPIDAPGAGTNRPYFWSGSSFWYPGSGDYAYAIGLYNSYAPPDKQNLTHRSFYRFGISGTGSPVWERLHEIPVYLNGFSSIIYDPDLGIVGSEGKRLFVFSGMNYTMPWEYSIEGSKWTTLVMSHLAGAYGSTACYPGTGDYIYYLASYQTKYFLRYSVSNNQWTRLADLPMPSYHVGKRITYLNGYIYCLAGYNTNYFYRYNINQSPGADNWETLTDFPNYDSTGVSGDADTLPDVNSGSSVQGIQIGGKDYIYAMRGSNCYTPGNSFYRYDVEAGTWTPLADTQMWYTAPYWYGFNGCYMSYPGYNESTVPGQTRTYIYASKGRSSRELWKYGPIEEDEDLGDDINSDGIMTGTWTRVVDAPSNFYFDQYYGSSLCPIGNSRYIYAYSASSDTNGYYSSWAIYDIATNTWRMGAEPAPLSLMFTTPVNVGDDIYIFGYYGNNRLWKYNIASDQWTPSVVDRQPASANSGNLAVDTANNYIYAVYGISSYSEDFYSHIWAYSAGDKRWISMIRAPSVMGTGCKGAYIPEGHSLYISKGRFSKKFFKYDITQNEWSKCATAHESWQGIQLCTGDPDPGDGYYGTGKVIYAKNGPGGNYLDIYYPAWDSWNTLSSGASVPQYSDLSNTMTYAGNKVYVLGLGTNNLYYLNLANKTWYTAAKVGDESADGTGVSTVLTGAGAALWKSTDSNYLYCAPIGGYDYFLSYDISGNVWKRLRTLPTILSEVCSGIVDCGGGTLFIYNPNFGGPFIRYKTSQDAYDQIVFLPETMRGSSSLCGYGGYLYYICGDDSAGDDSDAGTFYRYSATYNIWEKMNSAPVRFQNWGTTMLPVSHDGKLSIYVTAGETTNKIYRYDIPTGLWEVADTIPTGNTFGVGNCMAYADDGCLYIVQGSSQSMWRYNISAPSGSRWYDARSIPGALSASWGSSIVNGGGDYLYFLLGNYTQSLYRFNWRTGYWDTTSDLANCPVSVNQCLSKLAYPGFGNYLYFSQGAANGVDDPSYTFLRYKMTTNAWEELTPSPVDLRAPSSIVFPGGEYFYTARGRYYRNIIRYSAFSFGQYFSDVKEVGRHSSWGNVSWSPVGSSQAVDINVRSGNKPDLSDALDWGKVGKSGNPGDLSTSSAMGPADKYFQYMITFATDDLDSVPYLDSIQFTWKNYTKIPQALISRAFDSGFDKNRVIDLTWEEILPLATGGADIRLQMRTAPTQDLLNASPWLGPGGIQSFKYNFDAANSYFPDPHINAGTIGTVKLFKDLEDFPFSQTMVYDNTGSPASSNAIINLRIPPTYTHFWENVRSDGANIRFHDGTNKLSYFLSYFNYTDKEASVNLKIDLPDNAAKTIYLVYGSASSISESDYSVRDYTQLKADTSLVGWWDIEEGSGSSIEDTGLYLGGNNYLTYKGKSVLTWKNDGVFGGKCLSFDGISDYLLSPASAYFPYKGQGKTFSVWIRQNKPDPNGTYLLSSTWPYNWTIRLSSQGKVYISAANVRESYSSGASWGVWSAGKVPIDNKWHNVTIVLRPPEPDINKYPYNVKNNEVDIYIDNIKEQYSCTVGSNEENVPGNWNNVDSSVDMVVSNVHPSYYSDKGYYYAGDMDFITMFNRALSDSEVKDLYVGARTSKQACFYVNEEAIASPPASLPGWTYRLPVVVQNTTSYSTNFKVRIDIANWYQFWLHAKPDLGDLRVVDSNNTTLLTYQTPVYDFSSKKATTYITVPLSANQQKTIYLYYGNASATSSGVSYASGSELSVNVTYPYQNVSLNTFNTGVFYKDNPVIQPIFGVFYSDGGISSFSEIATDKNPPASDIRYQISPDGYHWYWWSGISWEESSGYATTNNATTVNLRLPEFKMLFPTADLYWRAWLHSDGSVTPKLNRVTIELVSGVTYYTDNTGSEPINESHSKTLTDDRWMQYKVILYSDGQDTPVLNKVDVKYIEPRITITSPVLDAEWPIGPHPKTISWTQEGLEDTTGGVKIEYYSRKLSDWVTIATDVPLLPGAYSWAEIPDDPTTSSYIRITSLDVPTISGTSQSFIIKGINITSPNGNPANKEIWEAGTTHNILWSSFGTLAGSHRLRLIYSTDGGLTYPAENLIAAYQTNAGTCPWDISPSVESEDVKVKIVSETDAQVIDESDRTFFILQPPSITVIQPAGDEKWIVGQNYTINWETNSQHFSDKFILEYSSDDGTTWPYTDSGDLSYFIAEVNSGAPVPLVNPTEHLVCSYDWVTPDNQSQTVKIRIREKTAPAGRDTTACVQAMSNTFKIVDPYVTITSPNGSESWVVGDVRDITWTKTGTVGASASLEWSRDNFLSDVHSITADCPIAAGVYSWTITSDVIEAGATSASLKIRIKDNSKPTRYDDSDEALTVISEPVAKVISPNGGEHFTAGREYEVRWETIGVYADTAKYKILYTVKENPVPADWEPVLGATNLSVDTSTHIGIYPLFSSGKVTQFAKVKVVSYLDATHPSRIVSDESDAYFTIDAPVVSITTPSGGENWFATGKYNIIWSTLGATSSNILIEYSIGQGPFLPVSPAPIASEIEAKSYLWTVPNNPGASVRVRVTDSEWAGKGYDVISTSSAFNIVSPVINISSPAAGYNWVVGLPGTISWTTQGGEVAAIKKLKVQCVADATHTYDIGEITDPVALAANTGSMDWTMPADAPLSTVTNKALIKIFDPDPNGSGVIATLQFNIKEPSLIVDSPTQASAWRIGSQNKTISWHRLGMVAYPIHIYCKTQDGVEHHLADISDQSVSASWNWPTVSFPGIIPGTSYIIIRDSTVPTPITTKFETERNGLFTIEAPRINVLGPSTQLKLDGTPNANYGQQWTTTDSRGVEWECDGSMDGPSFKVEWSRTVGESVAASGIIAEGLGAASRLALWTDIPAEAVGPNVRLKITNTGSSYNTFATSAPFIVFPVPEFTSLTLNDNTTGLPVPIVRLGNTYNIKWTRNEGAKGPVMLYYSINNGAAWPEITEDQLDRLTTEHSWSIPYTGIIPNANAQLKIYDTISWKYAGEAHAEKIIPINIGRPIFKDIKLIKSGSGEVVTSVALGEAPVIIWGWDGYINSGESILIKLVADTNNDGITDYEEAIPGFQQNTGIYNTWTVPDTAPATSHARIVIQDIFADYGPGNAVIDKSEEFTIINRPEITLITPNGGQDYIIGTDKINFAWQSKGISVAQVKIELSSDDFNTSYLVTDAAHLDGKFPNTGSLSDWLIPQNCAAGSRVKARISMVDRETEVYDVSEAYFRIRSGFIVKTPVFDEKWATNEVRTITWDTKGAIPKVSLLYSIDDGATFNPIPEAQNIDNTGTYSWKVPNERTDSIGKKAQIMVKDPEDTEGIIQNKSELFNIIWYKIKFYIIDKDTYSPIGNLIARSKDDPVTFYPGWNEPIDLITAQEQDYISSPVSHEFPAGTYVVTWSVKPDATGKSPYFDRGVEVKSDANTAMTGILVELENVVSAQIEWHVILTNSYNVEQDKLNATVWLERRGKLQEPIPIDTNDDTIPDALDKSNFKGCELKVYDYDTNTDTPVKTFTDVLPDDKGLFKFTWDGTGLQAGKTYFVRATITYGVSNTPYTSGGTFDITVPSEMKQMIDEHAEQTTLLETIQTQATAIQTAVEQTIPQKLTEATATIEKKVDATKAELKQDTARILTATEQTIPTQIKETVEPSLRSEILNRESTVRLGYKFMVRYRSYPGLSPVINVYDPRNKLVVSGLPMTEVNGSPGVYEYQLLLQSSWSVGDYTIVCSESTKGTMDAMLVSAIRTDLEEVAGQISTILGTTTSLSDLKDVADTLNSQFSIVESALGKISTDLVNKVKEVASSAGDIESVYSQLVNIGKELKTLGATQDVNLSKLLEVSKEKSQDIKYLKNKTQQLKAAMSINNKMIDNMAHKPVTQTWFEYK